MRECMLHWKLTSYFIVLVVARDDNNILASQLCYNILITASCEQEW